MAILATTKRVIVVHWKYRPDNPIEIFSNLKNVCSSYKQFNYNTLNNYLSKAKIPFENSEVRIERKYVISKPLSVSGLIERKIAPVVRRVAMKQANDEVRDLDYWLSRTPQERAAAVTDIIMQSVPKEARLDKSKIIRKSHSDIGSRL